MLKTEKEKSKKTLKKVMTRAEITTQAHRLAEYKVTRAKMLREYNHCITHRANPLPISKISYKINNTSKEATMRIKLNNDPLNLTVYDNFKLKMLGFSECVETQARKLGIPLPPELTAFGLSTAEKKRKRSLEIIKEVFVNEEILVDGMHRNLAPLSGVMGSRGLVISEPKLGIFFYNDNFDLMFQREEEFHLATTSQLIRTQSAIQRGTSEAEELFKKIELAIEARNDVAEARKIILTEIRLSIKGLAEFKASVSNEDSLSSKHQRAVKGLTEYKASASNLRRIQVEGIIKEVKDYLKTYSSAGMDISWYVKGIR
ncbi:hypothetical protein Tco_0927726 [Tanacetum coccineum]